VASVAVLPTGPVPVAAQIGCIGGNHHEMTGPRQDVLKAPGTEVRLVRLERMDLADLDGSAQRGINAHSRMAAITANAATRST
jgi:hypothetical protein